MYCEYYKLYKIINEYVNENVSDKKILELIKINNSFPVYKDLEPFKQYDFQFVLHLHENIITTLHSLCSFLMSKEHDLKGYQSKNKIGLNIDNFVNTFNYNNVVMKEKVTLFITYIEFFHKLHKKYLKRFSTKLQLMMSQVNNDIKFEDGVKTSDVNKKNILNSLKGDIENKTLLKDLHSIMSDNDLLSTSSDSSNKNIIKNESNDLSTDESERSNSDASENLIDDEIINGFPEIKLVSPRVHFSIDENNNREIFNNDKILFEIQNVNDECLSGLTNDSEDENKENKYNYIEKKSNNEDDNAAFEDDEDYEDCDDIIEENENNDKFISEDQVNDLIFLEKNEEINNETKNETSIKKKKRKKKKNDKKSSNNVVAIDNIVL